MCAATVVDIFTPTNIQPEPTQFINTPLNLRICERFAGHPILDLGPWVPSMKQSLQTGSVYSQGFSITPRELANRWGQHYHGPVLLITDARCYSATDIFAAGFKDHYLGTILGADDNTGAGGANVWTHELLSDLSKPSTPTHKESPYKTLPKGAGMRVSIRRTLRVGEYAGTPVEDLGIEPDERYYMTKDDVLSGNQDLLNRAGEILATKVVRKLDAKIEATAGTNSLSITIVGIDRLDIYLDNRPIESVDVSGEITQVGLNSPVSGRTLLIKGFHSGKVVATRKL
ncbi:MAG: hypothetical protein ACI9HY_000040 [Planctomycetaceae bacterium]|jgi:hypothetical protein